jgi:hypothetical protein
MNSVFLRKISRLYPALVCSLFLVAAGAIANVAFLPVSPASAQSGPDYWRVSGVASNDNLNIRSGPSTSYRIVALAPNGSVFRNLGCRGSGSSRWCHVETQNGRVSGWAAGRFLVEAGAPTTGNVSGQRDVPELHARNTGEMEVRFASGCTALFNPIGRRITAGSSCSRAQLRSSQNAVDSYLRENNPAASHSGGGSTSSNANINMSGNGTIYGGNAVSGRITGHREGAYALIISGSGLTCTGLLRHAPGVVRTESANVHCTNGASGTGTLATNRNGRGYTLTFTLTNGTGGYVIF